MAQPAQSGVLWDRPVRLLQPGPDHTSLVPNPEGFKLLESLSTKAVSVVSVIGNQRSGKSTLMNLMVHRNPGGNLSQQQEQGGQAAGQPARPAANGFSVGHYLDPQTMGLWLWAKVHPRNPSLVILYLDSEGLDSPHVPIHYNWLLSAVTILISDVFIYQSRGSIDSHATERLDVILKIVEHISRENPSGLAALSNRESTNAKKTGDFTRSNSSTRASSASSSSSSNSSCDDSMASNTRKAPVTQKYTTFFWLLRDHQLQMRQSPREELLEKLGPRAVKTMEGCFREYDCVPLPRPVQSDDLLQKLDKVGWNHLDRSFQDEFTVFERRLLGLLKERRSGFTDSIQPAFAASPSVANGTGFAPAQSARPVTGADVAALLKRYVAIIHNRSSNSILSDICELPTHSELLTQLAGEKCIKKALEYFGSRVSRDIELPNENFENIVFSFLEEARDNLVQNLLENGVSDIGEKSDLQKFLLVFDKKVGNTFETKFFPVQVSKASSSTPAADAKGAGKKAFLATPTTMGDRTPGARGTPGKDAADAGEGGTTFALAKVPVLDPGSNSFLYRKWMENKNALTERNKNQWRRQYWNSMEQKCRNTLNADVMNSSFETNAISTAAISTATPARSSSKEWGSFESAPNALSPAHSIASGIDNQTLLTSYYSQVEDYLQELSEKRKEYSKRFGGVSGGGNAVSSAEAENNFLLQTSWACRLVSVFNNRYSVMQCKEVEQKSNAQIQDLVNRFAVFEEEIGQKVKVSETLLGAKVDDIRNTVGHIRNNMMPEFQKKMTTMLQTLTSQTETKAMTAISAMDTSIKESMQQQKKDAKDDTLEKINISEQGMRNVITGEILEVKKFLNEREEIHREDTKKHFQSVGDAIDEKIAAVAKATETESKSYCNQKIINNNEIYDVKIKQSSDDLSLKVKAVLQTVKEQLLDGINKKANTEDVEKSTKDMESNLQTFQSTVENRLQELDTFKVEINTKISNDLATTVQKLKEDIVLGETIDDKICTATKQTVEGIHRVLEEQNARSVKETADLKQTLQGEISEVSTRMAEQKAVFTQVMDEQSRFVNEKAETMVEESQRLFNEFKVVMETDLNTVQKNIEETVANVETQVSDPNGLFDRLADNIDLRIRDSVDLSLRDYSETLCQPLTEGGLNLLSRAELEQLRNQIIEMDYMPRTELPTLLEAVVSKEALNSHLSEFKSHLDALKANLDGFVSSEKLDTHLEGLKSDLETHRTSLATHKEELENNLNNRLTEVANKSDLAAFIAKTELQDHLQEHVEKLATKPELEEIVEQAKVTAIENAQENSKTMVLKLHERMKDDMQRLDERNETRLTESLQAASSQLTSDILAQMGTQIGAQIGTHLEEPLQEKMEAFHNEKMNRFDEKIDAFDGKIGAFDEKIGAIEQDNATLRHEIETIRASAAASSAELSNTIDENLNTRMSSVQEQLSQQVMESNNLLNQLKESNGAEITNMTNNLNSIREEVQKSVANMQSSEGMIQFEKNMQETIAESEQKIGAAMSSTNEELKQSVETVHNNLNEQIMTLRKSFSQNVSMLIDNKTTAVKEELVNNITEQFQAMRCESERLSKELSILKDDVNIKASSDNEESQTLRTELTELSTRMSSKVSDQCLDEKLKESLTAESEKTKQVIQESLDNQIKEIKQAIGSRLKEHLTNAEEKRQTLEARFEQIAKQIVDSQQVSEKLAAVEAKINELSNGQFGTTNDLTTALQDVGNEWRSAIESRITEERQRSDSAMETMSSQVEIISSQIENVSSQLSSQVGDVKDTLDSEIAALRQQLDQITNETAELKSDTELMNSQLLSTAKKSATSAAVDRTELEHIKQVVGELKAKSEEGITSAIEAFVRDANLINADTFDEFKGGLGDFIKKTTASLEDQITTSKEETNEATKNLVRESMQKVEEAVSEKTMGKIEEILTEKATRLVEESISLHQHSMRDSLKIKFEQVESDIHRLKETSSASEEERESAEQKMRGMMEAVRNESKEMAEAMKGSVDPADLSTTIREELDNLLSEKMEESRVFQAEELQKVLENVKESHKEIREDVKQLSGQVTKVEDEVASDDKIRDFAARFEEHLLTKISAQIEESVLDKIDTSLTEKMKLGFQNIMAKIEERVEEVLEQRPPSTEEKQDMSIFVKSSDLGGELIHLERRITDGFESRLSTVIDSFNGKEKTSELIRKKLEEEIRSLQAGLNDQLEKLAEEVRNPRHVGDIWESIGTLSCRLTDIQALLDDLLGVKKMKMKKRIDGTPVRSPEK